VQAWRQQQHVADLPELAAQDAPGLQAFQPLDAAGGRVAIYRTSGLGMGVTKRPPHWRMNASFSMISFLMFQGRMST
jgi:Trk-type K+ transport system membrane component